jgi:hypothetical protein
MPLFPSEEARRRAVHTLARILGPLIVCFCIVDDHVHLVVGIDRRGSFSMVGRGVRAALGRLASAPLAAPHVKPIDSRSHLQNVVGYLLRQTDRHGLDAHPATWSGSSFQDFIGARVVPGMTGRIRELLPRFRRRDAMRIVGLNDELVPLEQDAVRALGAPRIVRAAAAVHAAPPSLSGRPPAVVSARRTAVHLAHASGVSPGEVAWALGVTGRSLRRLRQGPVSATAIRATRLRLALEEMVVRAVLSKAG